MTIPASTPGRLATWQADEAAVRARQKLPAAPIAPHQVAGWSELEAMQALVEGRLPAAPMAQALDFLLVHVAHGQASFQGRPGAKFLNPMGGLHGGWYATLLDSALGCAVHTTMAVGRVYTTLEFKINLVRAVPPGLPLVRAEGRTLHVGRQTATAEGHLVDADGRLYAHASTTCLIFDLPTAKARP